jgi:hypothetical protein
MTPEEQETAADRRATRNILAAVLFLIGVLIFLLFAPLNSAVLRSARRTVFGKRVAAGVESKQPGDQSTPEGNSLGPLPAEVQLRPPAEEIRAGAAGADEPAKNVGAPLATNTINAGLEDAGETNAPSQALLLDDFSQRLQQAGARSGDVQISLEWKNKNDLDLHVIDPFREEIFYRNRVSQSGGQLDVDMNLVRLDNGVEVAEDISHLTDKPVENVYWPEKGAARGMYRVEVVHYARHGAPDPTPFSVRVINRGQAAYYRGVISYNPNPARSRVTVCTFMVQ